MASRKKQSFVGVPGVLAGRRGTKAKPYWDGKRERWAFQVRLPSGQHKYVRTSFGKDEHDKAVEQQDATQRQLDAEADAAVEKLPDTYAKAGALHTVFTYSKKFLQKRESSYQHDEFRLRLYVYPHIGGMALREVQARHILEMVESLKKKLAPRTILNIYSVTSALFREACIAGLIAANPCILKQGVHLPSPRDKDPHWRARNSYTLDEVELLVSPHPFIETDSMVGYAILALTGMRLGELGRLRLNDYEEMWFGAGGSERDQNKSLCLGRFILTDTKTGDPRCVPVHPELALVMKEWLGWGWEKYTGRKPTPEDHIIPRVAGDLARQPHGPEDSARSLDTFKHRMRCHREALGWRKGRSIHTLRHTFISLAENNGADEAILKRATHKVPTDVWNNYTRVNWSKLCEQVLKVPVKRDVKLGVLGTWAQTDSIFPAPVTSGVEGPGRKRVGRYVKGQRPVDRHGRPIVGGRKPKALTG